LFPAQAHLDELKKLSDEHTQEVGSKNKEMANLASQLKQVPQEPADSWARRLPWPARPV